MRFLAHKSFYILLLSGAAGLCFVEAATAELNGSVVNPEALSSKHFVDIKKPNTFEELLEEDELVRDFFSKHPTLMQQVLGSPLLQREILSELNNAEDNAEKTALLEEYREEQEKEEQAYQTLKAQSFKQPVLRANIAPQASLSEATAETQPTPEAIPQAERAQKQEAENAQIVSAINALNKSNTAEINEKLEKARSSLESAERVSAFVNKVVEVRRQIIKEFMTLLQAEAPQAYEGLFENTSLVQKILDDELTLNETAIHLGVSNQGLLEKIQELDARIPLQKRPEGL